MREIIDGLLYCKERESQDACQSCPYAPDGRACAVDAAVEELRECECRVLTADDMDFIEDGTPVFLETREASWPKTMHIHEWVLYDGCQHTMETVTNAEDYLFFFKAIAKTILPLRFSTYGLEWRCWNGKPTPAEMEGAKWDG